MSFCCEQIPEFSVNVCGGVVNTMIKEKEIIEGVIILVKEDSITPNHWFPKCI